ncbi:hypothetical protein OfM1_18850 [Lactovum odontotermitis]
MDLESFSAQLSSVTGLPIAYHHFPKGDKTYTPPAPPFMIYYFNEDVSVLADDGSYYTIRSVTVELYTDRKEPEIEQKISDFFANLEIVPSHAEEWIDEEKMYMQIYDFDLGE